MSEYAVGSICEALQFVPVRWLADFVQFVEEGEASDEFLAFLECNAECVRACEIVLRADNPISWVLEVCAEPSEQKEADTPFIFEIRQ
jgi:hypothetical protein